MTEVVSTERLRGALNRVSGIEFSSQMEHFLSAAILFHAVPIDGVVKPEEMEALHRILMEDFELTEAMTDRLIISAKNSDKRDSFFAEVVTAAQQSLDHKQKKNLISQLWEVVFSDGHLHEAESNLVLQVGVDIGLDAEEACELMTSNF